VLRPERRKRLNNRKKMNHIQDLSQITLRKESVGRTRSRWDFNIKLMLKKHGARANNNNNIVIPVIIGQMELSRNHPENI
jgi:hypothetical protein